MNMTEKTSHESHPAFPAYGGFVQIDVKICSPRENLAGIEAALADLAPPAGGVVVLPELWASGFCYEELEDMAADTKHLLMNLVSLARRYHICLAGSLVEPQREEEESTYFNTLFFVGPAGILGSYRKQELFRPMAEDDYLVPGGDPRPVATPYGLLAGLVCFDLRFPELAWRQVAGGAGVLVVSAQWPAARLDHWRSLVLARAIENQVYVVACNRSGCTGATEFGGHSLVVAPDGAILCEAGSAAEAKGADFSPSLLAEVRSRFRTAGKTPYRYSDHGKIQTLDDLAVRVAAMRECGRKMVFTNGCFDILHEGHVTYLEAARKEGDYLVIGLNTDRSIRAIKGPDRPVNSQMSRARLLAALGAVDHVVFFDEETPLELIERLKPDVLVKGADWPVDKIVGAKEVFAAGGEVKTIELVGDFSTTGLIKKIRSL